MKILSIETSCDETAISLIAGEKSKKGAIEFHILGDVTISQISVHKHYGGVFPALAKREHGKNLIPILKEVLKDHAKPCSPATEKVRSLIGDTLHREGELHEAFVTYLATIEKPDIDAIAVTVGPGLEPTLWVGINFARALSAVWNIPILPVNHMEGHIFSAMISRKKFLIPNFKFLKKLESYKICEPNFPALALLISGGHTELILLKDWFSYDLMGKTRDDAVGEAYDKVARLLGLPYPGGPEVAREAALARKQKLEPITFPRPMLHSPLLDFSFSGLKTSVLYTLKHMATVSETDRKKIALGFEEAVNEVLITKVEKAVNETGAQTLIVGGGVAANDYLMGNVRSLAQRLGITFYAPPVQYTTDNALMIGVVGLCRALLLPQPYTKPEALQASGTLSL